MLNWFHTSNYCSSERLKITWRYTICWMTSWFVPRFGRLLGLPHSSRGIGLRSIQGDGPEALWVLQRGSATVEQQPERESVQKGMKCWMNGRRWPRRSDAVMAESRKGRTKAKNWIKLKDSNMKYVAGKVDGTQDKETEKSWASKKENNWPCTVRLTFHQKKKKRLTVKLLSLGGKAVKDIVLLSIVRHECGHTQTCSTAVNCAPLSCCVTPYTTIPVYVGGQAALCKACMIYKSNKQAAKRMTAREHMCVGLGCDNSINYQQKITSLAQEFTRSED